MQMAQKDAGATIKRETQIATDKRENMNWDRQQRRVGKLEAYVVGPTLACFFGQG